VPFVVSQDVLPYAPLFIICHGGRNVKGSWRGLQCEAPSRPGFVSVRRESGELLGPLSMPDGGKVSLLAPKQGFRQGERLELELGGESGALAPQLSLPSKMFLLVIPLPPAASRAPRTNFEPAKNVIGACLIHVTGAALHHLRVYAPSQTGVGGPFSVLVRPEDEYDNVACERPGELRVFSGDEELAGWRRVDRESSAGCLLEGLVRHEPGVFRLRVECAESAAGACVAQSNPIECVSPDCGPRTDVLWGMIHGHTENSDGAASLDHYFTYMRDECLLDFGAVGDHDHVFETSDEMWGLTQAAVAKYNDPTRFVTFLGYEWAKWRRNGDGDRNVYYLQDSRPLFRSDDGHCASPPELFRALRDETAMVIPHHPAEVGNHCDWKDHDPEKERLVEIYSEWGSSERSVNHGNPFPVRPSGGARAGGGGLDAGEVPSGFVQRALALGWRVGFTAGGDDHGSHPGDETRHGAPPWVYKAGLLAVRAEGNTREAVWDALWNRRCYATTGARMIVDFRLGGHPMGAELTLGEHPELHARRTITVSVDGAAPISRIEIVRNNEDVFVHQGGAEHETLTWEDAEPFESVALPAAQYWATPFCFYYVRVWQTDDEAAWISPIWVSP